MLDRMISEVETQEKLFCLDLDLLEDDDAKCVNTLELVPSSDALIELPIKVRQRELYESTSEIIIGDENNYELLSFCAKERKEVDDGASDLIQFDEPTGSVIQVPKSEVAAVLLEDDVKEKCLWSQRVKTASSESISDTSESATDSWNDNEHEYELVDTNDILSKYLSGSDPHPSDDIWWEGTFRNLSIVPEEDEDNTSLLESKPNRKFHSSLLGYEPIPKTNETGNAKGYETDSSTDEEHHESNEKVVKAEIKLMVKTYEEGKEAIEIRSVKEFTEPSLEHTERYRSQTLPTKLSSKEIGIFDKKISESCSYLGAKNVENKPVYTLQRLFVKTSDGSSSSLSNSRELCKSRTELIATGNENFPLTCNFGSYEILNNEEDNEHEIDLYANTPFYPCYEQNSIISPFPVRTNPFIEFTEPSRDVSSIPKAYCDWLPRADAPIRGNLCLSVLNSYAWVF